LAARKMMAERDYSLLVVDIMMPDENGIEFTRNIKKESNIPILMLTAKGEVADRIEGLESGADDYLSKPFEPKELYLRIMNLVGRAQKQASSGGGNIVRFGQFEFNLESHALSKDGERIFLSSTESELLSVLCSNANMPIDRMELVAKFNGISERSVDVQITRLRKKIEDDPKEPQFLQTSRGKGYVLRV